MSVTLPYVHPTTILLAGAGLGNAATLNDTDDTIGYDGTYEIPSVVSHARDLGSFTGDYLMVQVVNLTVTATTTPDAEWKEVCAQFIQARIDTGVSSTNIAGYDLYGLQSIASHYGTGALRSINGFYAAAYAAATVGDVEYVTGLDGSADYAGGGTAAHVENRMTASISGGGTITAVTPLNICAEASSGATGTVTACKMVNVRAAANYDTADPTWERVYGVYLEAQILGTIDCYNFYSAGAASKHYIAGKLVVGAQFTLPQGASPTLDAVGQFALDTTNNELLGHDGTAVRVYAHPVQAVNFCVGPDTTGWDSGTVPLTAFNKDLAGTIVQVDLTAIGTDTPTLTCNIEERAFGSYNSAGTNITAAPMVATGTGLSVTTFSNAGIAARAGLFLTTGSSAESGTVNALMGTIYFMRDRT